MKFSVKFPDILIIFFAVGITVFSFYSAYLKPHDNLKVLIRAEGKEWIYQISADETVKVKGPLGTTIIKIHDNHAWVESSPCDNQTCVAAGFIARQGQWTACLPNNVLVMTLGESDVDAFAW